MNTQTKRKFSCWGKGCYASSKEGEFVSIQSYKHDGNLHRTWRDTMVLKTSEFSVIGVNDHTLVTESDGRRWVTREPAIVYFHKNTGLMLLQWFEKRGFLLL